MCAFLDETEVHADLLVVTMTALAALVTREREVTVTVTVTVALDAVAVLRRQVHHKALPINLDCNLGQDYLTPA